MKFDRANAVEVLSATPGTLRTLLGGLSDGWISSSNHSDSWQAFDVVGHLIHGEETDWIPRARIILEQGENRTFVPFDRFAQFENSKGKSLADLLTEFEAARAKSLAELRSWHLTDEQLGLKGMHPELGEVMLGQLLATWVVHDLNHIRQIATSMAKLYDAEVGPWKEFLSI
ncbi:MAG TPA: DinB family protein, partial [Pyrinomonadaceae bacterium]|nr:DinB family protein [Pyrinomonadaceae bacterium]